MRGVLTKDSTLISEKFARSFCQALKRQGCVPNVLKKSEIIAQQVESKRAKLNQQKEAIQNLLKDGIRNSFRKSPLLKPDK